MKQMHLKRGFLFVAVMAMSIFVTDAALAAPSRDALREEAKSTMHRAATFYREQVATNGGYVYFYSADLKQRWGEGKATRTQIWVQPPGTPTVGMAYLKAYEATGDRFYLDAATDAAEALMYGQLKSGGWQNLIDFDPKGRVSQYRNGKGGGKNYSSLDDGQTQSAIRLLIHADKAHEFKHAAIHESAQFALDALLNAQFSNGAFPQVWKGPVADQTVKKASYPKYDWKTEGRIKQYWDLYTINDNVPGDVADTLIDAHTVYDDEKYLHALKNLGDFLILAQMPSAQPAWAQQYNYDMHPVWARKFEPPAIASDESQEVLQTLMKIYRGTGDEKYLKPIPPAIAYLKRSILSDGRLSRFYELRTNKPLYMTRDYQLTYDDSNVPTHYAFKIDSRLDEIAREYARLRRVDADPQKKRSTMELEKKVHRIIQDLDDQGRWLRTSGGEKLSGGAKFESGSQYFSSEVFSRNMEVLSEYLMATADE